MEETYFSDSHIPRNVFIKPGIKWKKGNFGDHFDPTFGIETYIRLNVDTRINRSISDKIDGGAVKIFIYF